MLNGLAYQVEEMNYSQFDITLKAYDEMYRPDPLKEAWRGDPYLWNPFSKNFACPIRNELIRDKR